MIGRDTFFLMPSWQVCSEVWLQRMLKILEPRLLAIGARDADPHWSEKEVPGICLEPQGSWKLRYITKAFGEKWETAYQKRLLQKNLRPIRQAAERGRLRYVFCNYLNFAMSWYDRLALPNITWIVHCHGWDIAWDGYSENSPYGPLHPHNYRDQVNAFSDKAYFIANSTYTSGKLKEMGIPEERIFLKYFGTETEWIQRDFSAGRALKVVYLGRLVDCKGPDLVVQAFLKALEQGFKGTLTMAGDGPMRNACELLARRSGYADKIRFMGTVSRKKAGNLLRDADIFTHHNCMGPLSKREEAFGVSLIEAMGLGLPVLTGRSGGVVESVVNNKTGILFAPGDIVAHAQAFLTLQNPKMRKEMSQTAYQHVCKNFSLVPEANQLDHIFRTLDSKMKDLR